jgi:amidase
LVVKSRYTLLLADHPVGTRDRSMQTMSRRGFLQAALPAGLAFTASSVRAGEDWPHAIETAARIRRGEWSAAEAVEAAIRRARALQPKLNFLACEDFERATARARHLHPRGALAGVPFLIKDLNDYVGLPTRQGSVSTVGARPATRQSAYITAFDRAGLLVIGKSLTPEFGLPSTTQSTAFGDTRNPWDIGRTSGGSSGGTAVAVAAGVVPAAHGNDGGGSIRIPASCCGVFGLKPSRGRMIGTRREVSISDLTCNHVLTRSVRDSAALLSITEDTGNGSRFPPVGLVTAALRRRLRVGLLTNTMIGNPTDAEVVAATQSVGKLLESLGHHVVATDWPVPGKLFIDDFVILWASLAAQVDSGRAPTGPGHSGAPYYENFTQGFIELAQHTSAEVRATALQRLAQAARSYTAWFDAQRLDVVLSPVVTTPAPGLEHFSPKLSFDVLLQREMDWVGFTTYHNIAGAPAMSMPLSWSSAGLPIGSQFAARPGGERVLLELAFQLEAARPWNRNWPAINARTI